MKTIVLTGGGTGGHVYPSLALVPELKKHFDRIHFVGSNGIERDIVENAGLPFSSVPSVKFNRSLSFSNFKIPFKMVSAVKSARELLKELKPDVVFSKGGYASLPTVLAARQMDVPVVCHESDATLGLANRLAKYHGATVTTALPDTAGQNEEFVFTGMPLREALFSVSTAEAKAKLGCKNNLPVFLVLGGSSGAVFLNKLIYSALPELTKTHFVVHISGKNGDKTVSSENYLQVEYTNQIEVYYAAADYVLSRAGATAVAELSALNKKTIIVPLPKGNSRGDQLANAEIARELGATVIFQHDLTDEVLLDALISLRSAQPMRSVGGNANGKIVNLLLSKAVPYVEQK